MEKAAVYSPPLNIKFRPRQKTGSFTLSPHTVYVTHGNNEDLIKSFFKDLGWTILQK
jgi:hypothetical protein